MKRRGLEYLYMLRDFPSVLSGRDYFHQPQGLGHYFADRRCYYTNMIGKTDWHGQYRDNVPARYIPSLQTHIVLPITVLQYGLGHIDRFLVQTHKPSLVAIEHVAIWILEHLNATSYFNNLFDTRDPQHLYHSNNSAMSQGHALSFLTRVVTYDLVTTNLASQLASRIDAIFGNMILPINRAGTSLQLDDGLYFCEYCRKDLYIVPNGWIYAIFGLLDYQNWSGNPVAKDNIAATLVTLGKVIEHYAMTDGWSYYDNKGRAASPFYHALHICLLDAVYRLTNNPAFMQIRDRFKASNTAINHCLFTLRKIVDKIRDSTLYAPGR